MYHQQQQQREDGDGPQSPSDYNNSNVVPFRSVSRSSSGANNTASVGSPTLRTSLRAASPLQSNQPRSSVMSLGGGGGGGARFNANNNNTNNHHNHNRHSSFTFGTTTYDGGDLQILRQVSSPLSRGSVGSGFFVVSGALRNNNNNSSHRRMTDSSAASSSANNDEQVLSLMRALVAISGARNSEGVFEWIHRNRHILREALIVEERPAAPPTGAAAATVSPFRTDSITSVPSGVHWGRESDVNDDYDNNNNNNNDDSDLDIADVVSMSTTRTNNYCATNTVTSDTRFPYLHGSAARTSISEEVLRRASVWQRQTVNIHRLTPPPPVPNTYNTNNNDNENDDDDEVLRPGSLGTPTTTISSKELPQQQEHQQPQQHPFDDTTSRASSMRLLTPTNRGGGMSQAQNKLGASGVLSDEDEEDTTAMRRWVKHQQHKEEQHNNTVTAHSHHAPPPDFLSVSQRLEQRFLDIKQRFIGPWETVLFAVVLYNYVAVTIRCGFEVPSSTAFIVFDMITDFVLVACVFVSTKVYGPDPELTEDIVRYQYFRSPAVVLDILGCLPWDFISLGVFWSGASEQKTIWLHEPCVLSPYARLPRLLFAHRLEYLLTTAFKRFFDNFLQIDPAWWRIVRSMIVFGLVVHMAACMWFWCLLALGMEEGFNKWALNPSLQTAALPLQYAQSLDFSMKSFVGMSRGAAFPQTDYGIIFMIIVSLIGVALYSLLLATIGSLVSNQETTEAKFALKMDQVLDFLAYRDMPENFKHDVVRYYHHVHNTSSTLVTLHTEFFAELPRDLRRRLAGVMGMSILKRVPIFQEAVMNTEFVIQVVSKLRPVVFQPNSTIISAGDDGNAMYFVITGQLAVWDKKMRHHLATLRAGDFFGEIAILIGCPRVANVVTNHNFSNCMELRRVDFDRVASQFSYCLESIRELASERLAAVERDMAARRIVGDVILASTDYGLRRRYFIMWVLFMHQGGGGQQQYKQQHTNNYQHYHHDQHQLELEREREGGGVVAPVLPPNMVLSSDDDEDENCKNRNKNKKAPSSSSATTKIFLPPPSTQTPEGSSSSNNNNNKNVITSLTSALETMTYTQQFLSAIGRHTAAAGKGGGLTPTNNNNNNNTNRVVAIDIAPESEKNSNCNNNNDSSTAKPQKKTMRLLDVSMSDSDASCSSSGRNEREDEGEEEEERVDFS